jgi:hypothetical protein
MSGQPLSEDNSLPSSGGIPDSTPLYSSYEHFKPGLQILSNDPSSEDEQQQQPRMTSDSGDTWADNPPTSAALGISEQDAPPAPQNPSTITGSSSAGALPQTELELKETNEPGDKDKVMNWWPDPEADEIKVERL